MKSMIAFNPTVINRGAVLLGLFAGATEKYNWLATFLVGQMILSGIGFILSTISMIQNILMHFEA